MELLAIVGLFFIIWIIKSNFDTDNTIQTTAESLYKFVCNLLQGNQTYNNLLEKISNNIKPENYTREDEEIYWEEETFPELTFHAKKNYSEDDYSLYIFSNHRSVTKKYYGLMICLSSPKCVDEQATFRNIWGISADDSMFGYKAKRDAIVLGKTLCNVVNSHKRIANFSRNRQIPGV